MLRTTGDTCAVASPLCTPQCPSPLDPLGSRGLVCVILKPLTVIPVHLSMNTQLSALICVEE